MVEIKPFFQIFHFYSSAFSGTKIFPFSCGEISLVFGFLEVNNL